MYIGRDFTDMDVGEEENFSFDFAYDLAPGETIVGTTWTCLLVEGKDPNVASRLDGFPQVQGTRSVQRIIAGPDGAKYILRANVTTSANNKLSLWSHVTCAAPA